MSLLLFVCKRIYVLVAAARRSTADTPLVAKLMAPCAAEAQRIVAMRTDEDGLPLIALRAHNPEEKRRNAHVKTASPRA